MRIEPLQNTVHSWKKPGGGGGRAAGARPLAPGGRFDEQVRHRGDSPVITAAFEEVLRERARGHRWCSLKYGAEMNKYVHSCWTEPHWRRYHPPRARTARWWRAVLLKVQARTHSTPPELVWCPSGADGRLRPAGRWPARCVHTPPRTTSVHLVVGGPFRKVDRRSINPEELFAPVILVRCRLRSDAHGILRARWPAPRCAGHGSTAAGLKAQWYGETAYGDHAGARVRRRFNSAASVPHLQVTRVPGAGGNKSFLAVEARGSWRELLPGWSAVRARTPGRQLSDASGAATTALPQRGCLVVISLLASDPTASVK